MPLQSVTSLPSAVPSARTVTAQTATGSSFTSMLAQASTASKTRQVPGGEGEAHPKADSHESGRKAAASPATSAATPIAGQANPVMSPPQVPITPPVQTPVAPSAKLPADTVDTVDSDARDVSAAGSATAPDKAAETANKSGSWGPMDISPFSPAVDPTSMFAESPDSKSGAPQAQAKSSDIAAVAVVPATAGLTSLAAIPAAASLPTPIPLPSGRGAEAKAAGKVTGKPEAAGGTVGKDKPEKLDSASSEDGPTAAGAQGVHKPDAASGQSGDPRQQTGGSTAAPLLTQNPAAPANLIPTSQPVQPATSEIASASGSGASNGQQDNAGGVPSSDAHIASLEAQPLPAINTARVIQSMQGAEMRVGMHSAEFGSVSISTSMSHQAIAAQISFEHADLGRALTTHLPAIEAKLASDYGMRASVEMRDQSLGSAAEGRSGDGRQNQRGAPERVLPVSADPFAGDKGDKGGATGGLRNSAITGDSLRLDIRI